MSEIPTPGDDRDFSRGHVGGQPDQFPSSAPPSGLEAGQPENPNLPGTHTEVASLTVPSEEPRKNILNRLGQKTEGWLRGMGLISYDTDVHLSHERPADKEGDWDVDDKSVKLTPLQRVAKWSKGWLTAANIVSIGAAGLTAKGIVDVAHGDAVRGVVEIGAGRVGDLVDGAVALWTKTRGKIGALVDSGLDKLRSGFGLYELTAVSHDIPVWMAVPIALQQGTIIALNKIIHNRGGSPTPNKAGKWGMAALWGYFGAIVSYQAMQALHWSHEEVASAIGYLSGLGAVGLSGVAIYDYSMQSKLLKKPAESAELPN